MGPVYVFIREIQPAGKSGFIVNDRNLAVIAVVHGHQQGRPYPVEPIGFNAERVQIAVISSWKIKRTAKIVIDDLDFHAFRCLLFQNLKDLIPHPANADDVILQEDKLFCVPEFLKKCGQEFFSAVEISDRGVLIDRKPRDPEPLIKNPAQMRIFLRKPGSGFRILFQKTAHAAVSFNCSVGKTFRHLSAKAHQKKHTAHKRQCKNQKTPADLIRTVFVFIDYINRNHKRNQRDQPGQAVIQSCAVNAKYQQCDLQNHKKRQ